MYMSRFIITHFFSNCKSPRFQYTFKPSDQLDTCRPLLVGFRYQQDQETVLSNCWRLAKDKKLGKVSVGRDLTDRERKRESDLMVEAKAKNMNRSNEKKYHILSDNIRFLNSDHNFGTS